MKKQISLTIEGKITKSKEEILIKWLQSTGEALRMFKKPGMDIQSVKVTSKDILDIE